MNLTSRPLVRGLACIAAAVGSSACAGGLPEVESVDVPRLEQAVASSPDDTDLQVQLGMAQFKAREHEAARATLQGAVEAGNESGPAFLYLGLAQEELEDWSGARDAYNRYLTVGASGPGRAQVRERLTLIGRNLLRVQAQQALAQEQEITATAQFQPQSVAVLPLAFNSGNQDLEPLIYALSDMMITDFKVSNALVVLERTQIQTLLDEMALTSSGYAEASTGARAGRLLRAEHVFQGVLTTLGDEELQTDADILNVPSTSSAGELSESARLEQLFDMEKQIVIRTIGEVLGVELTPAEEQAILENRTDNVLAFLAYGRGLRRLDEGDYDGAQAEFELAASLDPAFQPAQTALAETAALQNASQTGTADIAVIAGATGETTAGLFGPPAATTTEDLTSIGISPESPLGAGSSTGAQTTGSLTLNALSNVAEGVDPSPTTATLGLGSAEQSRNPTPEQSQPTTRDPLQELQGESISGSTQAQIRIVIRRPGGGQ
jgi:Tfp pilus assembly protein PilF/TolB-like protein